MISVDKMNVLNHLDIPGEHPFTFDGVAGSLEGVLTVPYAINYQYIAILGHPHSLQGGTMNNKVVTTLARAFKELEIASLRFNFRGVQGSQGAYDAGIGESEDMLLLAAQCARHNPHTKVIFAGFSFGSYVAYRAASQFENSLLITVAPAVHHYDYAEFSPRPTPWVVLHGDQDEVVPFSLAQAFVEQHPTIELIHFANTSHFFHGQLIPLKTSILDAVRTHVIS